ncbi:hypothetical protein E3N88_38252 [Mikania micrantha]|uniref:CCHC-type domain-containing protein n=1 Tax=Mikania micrantha TaxID=192012 RepID=A0A5N6LU87_9ASTR|nr:hypothetical protein E3N88_38252 [Mikania micrantha]
MEIHEDHWVKVVSEQGLRNQILTKASLSQILTSLNTLNMKVRAMVPVDTLDRLKPRGIMRIKHNCADTLHLPNYVEQSKEYLKEEFARFVKWFYEEHFNQKNKEYPLNYRMGVLLNSWIYICISKAGGYDKASKFCKWPEIAIKLGFDKSYATNLMIVYQGYLDLCLGEDLGEEGEINGEAKSNDGSYVDIEALEEEDFNGGWKDFKYALKHIKDDLNLVQLGSHLRIEESLRSQESDKGKSKLDDVQSVVNLVEHKKKLKKIDINQKGKRKFKGNYQDSHKKQKIVCWNCGKPGHLKRDCRVISTVGKKSFIQWVQVGLRIHLHMQGFWGGSNATTYELWKDKPPNLYYLKFWGYRAIVRLT